MRRPPSPVLACLAGPSPPSILAPLTTTITMSTTPPLLSPSDPPPQPYSVARRSISETLKGPGSTNPADLASRPLHPILRSWAQDQIARARTAHWTARICGERPEYHYQRQRESVGLHREVLPTPQLSLSGAVLTTITTMPTFGAANAGNPWGPATATPCQCSYALPNSPCPVPPINPLQATSAFLPPFPVAELTGEGVETD